MPMVCLHFVIMVFPDHTHLLFLLLLVSGRRLHSNVLSVHCEQELVGYASLLVGYGVWGDLIHHCETRRGLKKLRYLCELYK